MRPASESGEKPPNTTEWDRADARAGLHGHHRLGNHGQVDGDAVPFLTPRFVSRLAARTGVQLAVADATRVVRIVALEDDRGLVTARGEVAVQAIGRDVQLAVVEPADVRVGGVGSSRPSPG